MLVPCAFPKFPENAGRKPSGIFTRGFFVTAPGDLSGGIHPVHFYDLTVLHTDGGIVGSDMIICDCTNQEVTGIIQDFSTVQIGCVVIEEIYGYPNGSLSDGIPVFYVTVAKIIDKLHL